MTRRVVVSSLGVPSPAAPSGAGSSASTGALIDFWREKLGQVAPWQPDLIVLPELANCFSDASPELSCRLAEADGGRMLAFFSEMAREYRCNLVYPALSALDDGTFRNRTHVLNRAGEVIGIYDKNHATILETQQYGIVSGQEAPIIECDFGRIACVTCFDLNFDELRVRYAAQRPDLLVFSSLFHGGLMQGYWAYTCRAHFISAIGFPGLRSEILNPLGQTLASTTIYQNYATATLNLDCRLAHLDGNVERLKALKARYGPQVTITDPDLLGVVSIASETAETSTGDMIGEFEIELLDEYLDRSRTWQSAPRDREMALA